MYLGLDLGTSSVKALLVDDEERVVGEGTASLDVSRPRPLWSEQDPEDWWSATLSAVDAARSSSPGGLSAVRGIGLSGQMHGAILLGQDDRVLRPAILWNDGRSSAECEELTRRVPDLVEITGNVAMPGFTAPKLLWVAKHEPAVFAQTARVLLPKDYLRLRLTGDHATDFSDAAGTLWLDVGRRRWSERMLAATNMDERAMPSLHDGTSPTSTLREELCERWGMPRRVVVAAGGGDNAAGAAGLGVVSPGQAFVSLGTSGVYFVPTREFSPNAAGGVHTFCHCVPGTFHQMAVLLSAASAVSWAARVLRTDEATLALELDAGPDRPSPVVFLPYLSGERTPHDDPHAQGVFFGLTHDTTRSDLVRAVFEGVAFGFADGQAELLRGGARLEDVYVIGGGARSVAWARVLASVLGRPLHYGARADLGAAFGAARLARAAVTSEPPETLFRLPERERTVHPDPSLTDAYAPRLARYRRLYARLRDEFRHP